MEYYFDTSSLVALARYYHPFDKNGRLFDFVRSKFQNKEIIVLDAILNEAKFTSKGIVLQENLRKDFLVSGIDVGHYAESAYQKTAPDAN